MDISTGRTQVSMVQAHYREANIQSRQSSIHLPLAAPNHYIVPISNDTQLSSLKTAENEQELEEQTKIIVPYKKESSTKSSSIGQTKFMPHDQLILPDTQESDRDQQS